MKAPDVFFDTNVLLNVMSADQAKVDRAETLIAAGVDSLSHLGRGSTTELVATVVTPERNML
jgi:predicted nucleic acid-binding protein